MLFQIKSYLIFLWHSKNEHGVHSPFVFHLLTKCFYDKKVKPVDTILENYRNSLLANNDTIEVTDFGAGSRVFKSNTRSISKIAKTAGISSKRAALLYRIVHYLQPESILEIGTSLGMATAALFLGSQNLKTKVKVITLEGCPETVRQAQNQFKQFGFTTINSIKTEFSSYFNSLQFSGFNFGLIYFDGNHSKKATLEYFELLLSTVSNDTVWIFDDIHWSQEMEEAWEIIKSHPQVTVTIDTFQWGLVFFRREQPKEHFVIRV
ncbi:Predicted O-methyltransferase YrrM [Flavobacterium fryxellicola]|uniref:Methyltransferase n=1 Tax=Flavobacterium fryxellicola TaxID=249352 RepID=A0A167Y1L7_9FLAO|nr:class I SAM-dependent methyltransferase [Flavobacterium fryxellicola]OAB28931.1 methyltransferase [Flavobacterium fryxellicola]SHN60079.1 Predicted O-methyltransferase YrrM [Flavobacterium fryxellicola]